MGAVGSNGSIGAAGAAGPTGAAYSNVFSVDPTTYTSGATIPNNAYSVYFVNNSSTATITLPLSSAGKRILIVPTAPGNGITISITTQGGDQIYGSNVTIGPTIGVGSTLNPTEIVNGFLSDKSGRWIWLPVNQR
jgi:hypothetical protein